MTLSYFLLSAILWHPSSSSWWRSDQWLSRLEGSSILVFVLTAWFISCFLSCRYFQWRSNVFQFSFQGIFYLWIHLLWGERRNILLLFILCINHVLSKNYKFELCEYLFSELPDCSNQNRNDAYSSCRVCVIKWLAGYTQDIKQKHYTNMPLISKFIGYIIQ